MTIDIQLEQFHMKLFLNRQPNGKGILRNYLTNPTEHDRQILRKYKFLDQDEKIKTVYLHLINQL